MRLSLFAHTGDSALGKDQTADRAIRISSIDALWDNRLDGLIVTGAEPIASRPDRTSHTGQPGTINRLGGAQHVFVHLELPGRARRRAAARWHQDGVHLRTNFSESLNVPK